MGEEAGGREVRMGGMEKNGHEGKGREVSGLGHVSLTVESPQGRGAGAWPGLDELRVRA